MNAQYVVYIPRMGNYLKADTKGWTRDPKEARKFASMSEARRTVSEAFPQVKFTITKASA